MHHPVLIRPQAMSVSLEAVFSNNHTCQNVKINQLFFVKTVIKLIKLDIQHQSASSVPLLC